MPATGPRGAAGGAGGGAMAGHRGAAKGAGAAAATGVAARAAVAPAPAGAGAGALRSVRRADLSAEELRGLMARPRIDFTAILDTVKPIVDAVGAEGDAAVLEYTARFDRVELSETVRDPLPASSS